MRATKRLQQDRENGEVTMRLLSEDTVVDKLLRFGFGAAVGAAMALFVLGMNYFFMGHVHVPVLVVAIFAIVVGISAVRRVPRA
jgi:hypothetical protein